MKNKNVVIKKSCHFRGMWSGIFHVPNRSSRDLIKANAFDFKGKTLRKTYRLGVSQTGAVSKPRNSCCQSRELSSSHLTYKVEDLNKGSFRAPLLSGFTLIELLVVVLIIGILTAVALPQYQKAVAKSHYATIKPLLKSIAHAQEIYYLSNGEYADSMDKLAVTAPAGYVSSSTATDWDYPWGRCATYSNGATYCVYRSNSTDWSAWIRLRTWGIHSIETYEDIGLAGKYVCDARGNIFDKICQQETGKSVPDIVASNTNTYFY